MKCRGYKVKSINNGCFSVWIAEYKIMQIDSYLSSSTKMNSKRCIKGLKIKLDTLSLRDEKVENSLEYIGVGDNFLNRKNTPIAQALRSTISKLSSFYKSEDTIIWTK